MINVWNYTVPKIANATSIASADIND